MGQSYLEIIRILLTMAAFWVMLTVRRHPLIGQRPGFKTILQGFVGLILGSALVLFEQNWFPSSSFATVAYIVMGLACIYCGYGIWRFFLSIAELADSEVKLQADTQRLTDILDAGTDGSWDWPRGSEQCWLSPGFLKLLGREQESAWVDINPLIHPDDRVNLDDELVQYFNGQRDCFSLELRMLHREGHYIWLLIRGKILPAPALVPEQAPRLLGSVTNINERKAEDRLMSAIAESISAHTGQHFLHSLAQHLQQALNANGVFVAQISGENLMQTALLSQGDKVLANETFCYQGTACEEVLHSGAKLLHLANKERQFLRQLPANYMAAIALKSGDGHVNGILAVLFQEPPKQEAKIYSLLRIFGVRVAAELERSLAETTLRQREASYRSFINKSSEGIWCLDFDEPISIHQPVKEITQQIFNRGYMAECNRVVAQMYGYANPDDINGEYLSSLLPAKFLRFLFRGFEKFVSHDFHLADAKEYPIRQSDGIHWYTTNMTGIYENGLLYRIWGIHRDISELHQHLQKIEYQANHDALTGLPNRYALVKELDRITQAEQALSLMIMDLNRFKEINDSLGHQYGDNLLFQIGPRLKNLMQQYDATLVRLGGDEFAILVAANDEILLEEICTQVLALLQQPFELDGGFSVEIGASIGIASFNSQMASHSDLMRCADVAMYVAKQRSLGYCFYSEDADTHSPDHLVLVTELSKAIRENELVLHFQPKIHLNDQSLAGAEVLVRWRHPLRGLVPPGRFIPVAEATDLIRPLTHWVLENAIKQARQWRDEAGMEIKLAINISARNLLDQQLPDLVQALLDKYDIPAGLIELEITESAVMADTKMAREILQAIGELGVEISIDDFGTGYTSLGYLDYLPIDKLKIDLSFVRNMLDNDHDAKIVRTITNLAHDFGLSVVAEGIETVAIQKALLKLGCDQGQGYYISPPLASDKLLSWLEKRNLTTI